MIARGSVAGLLALTLGGCSLAPPFELPPPPVPASWGTGDAYLAQSEAALPFVSYTKVFSDPRLQMLIEKAIVDNRDLRVATANLAAARAQIRETRTAQFPSIGIDGSFDATRGNTGTIVNSTSGGRTRTIFSVQGGVSSYEIDLLGKYADATEADRNRALATEAFARTVRLALVADIAGAWATYAADNDLLVIAQQTAANARDGVRLTESRLKGGVAPRTDLTQAQQVLAAAEISIAEQTAAIARDRNLLRLLVGAEFDPALLPSTLAEIAPGYAALPADLDSSILLRRPDVIEAEFRLRAAGAEIGVARASLFPSLSLTGLLGLASSALGDLLTGGAFQFAAGADARYSIFDAGAGRARVAVSQAQRDAALATYEATLQTAFREVADALADQGTLAARQRAAQNNVDAATTTARLTEARYRNGIDSFLDYLIAQRSLFSARQQLVTIELATVQNRTTIYRVLGGDATSEGFRRPK